MDNESTNETHRIVVGVDGSKDSIRALEWAAPSVAALVAVAPASGELAVRAGRMESRSGPE